MSCCSNAMWKHLIATGELTKDALRDAAAVWRATLAAADAVDKLFVNGTFLLAEPTVADEHVTAVAISGETIVDVGDAIRLRAAYPAAEVIDLRGATLAPGFVEAHAHIIAATQNAYSLDLRGLTFPQVLATIAGKVKTAKTSSWLFFMNFDPSLCDFDPTYGFPQLGFTELDAMPNADQVNVFVENASGHIAYANSTAFATCNITADTKPPPAGGHYGVDDHHLTGVMFEPPTFSPFLKHTQGLASAEQLFGEMLGFLALAQRAGVTTVADPAVGIGGDLELELVLYDLFASLPISTDVVGSLDATCLYSTTDGPKLIFPGLQAPAGPGQTGSFGNLVIPAVKIWSDGSTQGYTGYLEHDYLTPVTPKGLGPRGAPDWTKDQLRDLLTQARNDNWGSLIHANGDAAVAMALDAIEHAYGARSGFRNRLEHCTLASPEQYDRMAVLGVTPTYLTNHIAIWGDTFNEHILGNPRASRLDAARDARDRDLIFSFHCDYATSMPGPLTYMQTAVTRRTAKHVQLGPDLTIEPLEALKAVTIYPARQLGLDATIGTITAGKRANFVELANDPTTVAPDQIALIPILRTYLRGRAIAIGSAS